MSVAVQIELDRAREALAALVDDLVMPSKRRLDDGRLAEVLPVIESVVDALTARGEPAVKNSAPKSMRSPLRLSAVELLAHVDRTVGGQRALSRSTRVYAWSSRVLASNSLDEVTEGVQLVGWWLAAARNLLEPNRHLPLRGAVCPACGFRDAVGPGDQGEDIREPALTVEIKTGIVSCLIDGCGAQWPADALEDLAAQLQRQTTVEHLACQ